MILIVKSCCFHIQECPFENRNLDKLLEEEEEEEDHAGNCHANRHLRRLLVGDEVRVVEWRRRHSVLSRTGRRREVLRSDALMPGRSAVAGGAEGIGYLYDIKIGKRWRVLCAVRVNWMAFGNAMQCPHFVSRFSSQKMCVRAYAHFLLTVGRIKDLFWTQIYS